MFLSLVIPHPNHTHGSCSLQTTKWWIVKLGNLSWLDPIQRIISAEQWGVNSLNCSTSSWLKLASLLLPIHPLATSNFHDSIMRFGLQRTHYRLWLILQPKTTWSILGLTKQFLQWWEQHDIPLFSRSNIRNLGRQWIPCMIVLYFEFEQINPPFSLLFLFHNLLSHFSFL